MEKKVFKDCEVGDKLYLIEFNNNLNIKETTFKSKTHYWHEASYTIYLENETPSTGCIDARSRNKNLFTTKEEAEEFRNEIINGKKVFLTAKKGDTVYIVVRGESDILKSKLDYDYDRSTPTERVRFYFCKYKKYITDFPSELEDKAEISFYNDAYKRVIVKYFLNEKDAINYIKYSERRKKKNATDKYIKSIENHDGKPISLKDNAGNDLHYGDTVVYIRRIGYNAHPELRKGVIIGESKTTIRVLDECEKKNGIPMGFRGERTKESDGTHSVQSQSVMLFKTAEVNTKSGFVFTK